MLKISKRILSIIFAIFLFASGAFAADRGNEVVIATENFSTNHLSLVTANYYDVDNVILPIHDSLLEIDYDRKITPGLAESWEVSDDRSRITFHLRKGVKFHDGNELTADDVVYTLNRYSKDDAVNHRSFKAQFASVEKLDDYTVRVAFKAPSPTIERDFAAHYSYSGYILPKKYIEEKGEDYFSAHPIGSGPYQISDIKQDVSITFKAVPNHWRIQPDFETLILRNVPDNSTRVAMLKGGQVDLIQLSFDNLEELSANPKVHFLRIPFERMSTIIIQGAWQDDGEAVQNLKVRQALDYAINREEISKEFFSGYAKPEKYWKVSEAGEIWDTAWDNEATPYDPQKARELLAEAGYPDAFKYPAVRVYTQTERAYQVKLTELIASYWEAVGIKVEIFVNDVVTTGNVLYGNPELPRDSYGAVFVWTSPVGLNDGILNASQKTFYVTTGIASASRVDKEIDEWYRLGERELDVKTRNEYDLKILKRVHDENKYFLGLNYIDTIWAASNKVAGWDADRRPGSFAATYPSIKKNEQ